MRALSGLAAAAVADRMIICAKRMTSELEIPRSYYGNPSTLPEMRYCRRARS